MIKGLEQFLIQLTNEYKGQSIGKCANYIPALSKQNPEIMAISLCFPQGHALNIGETNYAFTVQSISKVFSFIAACTAIGIEGVLSKVDVEPTGDSFNSLLRFELSDAKKPFNPWINAGAITVVSLLPGNTAEDKVNFVLDFLTSVIGKRLKINQDVFVSEWETADRNKAMVHFLKEKQILSGDVDEILKAYTKLCSMELTVGDLAKFGCLLSTDGYDLEKRAQVFPIEVARLTKILMYTSGMYNGSGKFATTIGIPAKSGVSGGILGIIPASPKSHPLFVDGLGLGIFSPPLDENGNSVKSMIVMEKLFQHYPVTIF
ncbi:glutaminase A [Lysinibacillus sp. LZ02]|uniref:glutaminase A n=1 Tax=Lysinibacillus sp. LZ02 TaxID=3420668 RepID=UPI003D369200